MKLNFINQLLFNNLKQNSINTVGELQIFASFIYYFTVAETIFVSTLVVVAVFMVSIGVVNVVPNYSASSLFLNLLLIFICYFSYIAIKAVQLSYSLLLKTVSQISKVETESKDIKENTNE